MWIVPPGDYYFTRLDFKSGNGGILLLTHLGRIRIWVDTPESGPVQQDSLKTVVFFTDTTPSKFRLFYNKCSTLNIEGSSTFNGGFYAVKDGCSTDTPSMNFTGNTTVYGSVITSYFDVSGGTKIIFPNDGSGADPTDFSLWFGFKDGWKEVSPNGNPIWADGSSK